jgi:hypothetical protein
MYYMTSFIFLQYIWNFIYLFIYSFIKYLWSEYYLLEIMQWGYTVEKIQCSCSNMKMPIHSISTYPQDQKEWYFSFIFIKNF